MGQALTTSSDEATDAARSSEAVGFFADDCPFTELVNELAHASKGDRQVVKMLEAQHVDRKNEFMQIVRLGHSHCPFGASQVAEASGAQVLAIQRLSDIYDTTRLSRRKLTLREVVLSLQASRSSRCTCESCPERQHLAHSLRLRRSAFVGLLQLVRALLRDALRRRASVRRGACPHGCLCVPAWLLVRACAALARSGVRCNMFWWIGSFPSWLPGHGRWQSAEAAEPAVRGQGYAPHLRAHHRCRGPVPT